MCKIISKNNKGSALVLIVVVGFFVSAGILFYFSRLSMQKHILVKQKADAELEEVFTRISSLFVSPAHCNANFYLASGYFAPNGSLTRVNRCQNGQACRPGEASNHTNLELNVTESTWDINTTKTTTHVRLGKATYTLLHTQNGDDNDPSILRMNFEFHKSYGSTTNFVKVNRSIDFPIVLNETLDGIIGCPKSPNTITVY